MTDLNTAQVGGVAAATAAPRPAPPTATPVGSGLRFVAARISNFRGLRSVDVELDQMTVLLGANNAGKSSFLDAICVAVGAQRRPVGKDDIHLAAQETDAPKDRAATIDLLIRPIGSDGLVSGAFESGSYWTGLFSTAISQDDQFRDFVAIRARIAWSVAHGEYRVERHFLKEWLPPATWLAASDKGMVSAAQIEPIALHYIDAKRDMDEDLKSRASFWRRLTDDLGLDESSVAEAEQMLSDLNNKLIAQSDVLKHVGGHLSELKGVLASGTASVEISPVARRLRDLSKGLDVSISGAGSLSFPLARHGMGTRSLASMLVFKAFASWRSQQAEADHNRVHSFLALEEPEAHLHPQAQRSLFSAVEKIPAQVLVSTHSPYFSGQAKLSQLRLLHKTGVSTEIRRLDMATIPPNDVRKLEEKIVLTRGDLLFSTALLLFEGDTEECAFPVFAQRYWGSSVHELGLSFVPVGGGDYFPYIWLAKELGIPWFIVTDAEQKPLQTLDAALARAGFQSHTQCSNVVAFDPGNDFEGQLVADGYSPQIEAAFDLAESTPDYLTTYMAQMAGQLKRGGLPRDYHLADGRTRALLDCMRENKARMASAIAGQIVELLDDELATPAHIRRCFEEISRRMGW